MGGLEVSGAVVAASVFVGGEGVLNAQVVQEVGGVVVPVVVLVAPDMPLDDFVGLDAAVAAGQVAGYPFGEVGRVSECRLAVAVCGA